MDKNDEALGGETENDEAGTTAAPAEDFEREARMQGWVPAEQFRGHEDEWVDSETFVKRGRELNPILRANNRRLMGQVESLQAQQRETEQSIREFRQYHEETEARAYAKAVSDLKAQRKQALLDNDAAGALEAEEAIERVDAEMYDKQQAKAKSRKTAPSSQPSAAEAVSQADIADFTSRHEWFSKDKIKTQLTLSLGEELHGQYPALVGKPFLDELERRMEERFPNEFGNPNRSRASKMEGSGAGDSGSRASGPRGKTAADLPPEARATMERYVKAKLLTKEQYLNDYSW